MEAKDFSQASEKAEAAFSGDIYNNSHVITIMIVATFLAVAKKEGSPNGVPFRLFISKETDLTLNK